MSECARLRPGYGAFVLGGLEPEEFDEVEDHLASCSACREDVAELVDLPPLLELAADAPPQAPADLRQRVLERPRPRRLILLVAAAGTLLGLIVGAVGMAVVQSPPPADARLAVAGATEDAVSGRSVLRQVEAGVRVDLDLVDVRPADEGYYHVWLHRGDIPVSAGTFVGPPEGTAAIQLLCGGQLEDYDRLTITWHPHGEDERLAAASTIDLSAP